MQSVIFQNAMRIIRQVLDWSEVALENSILSRITDSWTDGIAANTLNNFTIVGKDTDPLLTDFFHVEVQTGLAYSSGERINLTGSLVTYNAANPTQTTDDGTGNFVLTPQSTGSFDIPLTAGSINYIYISYLRTTDTSVFTLNAINQAKQFYHADDGYQIIVNLTGIQPADSVFLGQVNLLGANTAISSNISQIGRSYFKTKLNRVGIQTNNVGKTDRPADYSIGLNNYFLDDHIKSVGSGTVSNFNPHGLGIVDLGLNVNDTTSFHRLYEHTNGIIAGTPLDGYPQNSGLFCQRVQVGSGDDFIVVKGLITGEAIIVDGIAYTVTQFPLTTYLPFRGCVDVTSLSHPTFTITSVTDSTHLVVSNTSGISTGDIITQQVVVGPTSTFVTTVVTGVISATNLVVVDTTGFSASPGMSSGTYQVYFDQPTLSIQVTSLNITNDITKIWLCTVIWDASNPIDGNLSNPIDRRRLGTTNLLQRWNTEPLNPLRGEFGFNYSNNFLEYYDGTTWQIPVVTSSNALVPPGAMLDFAGTFAPAGFVLCNGASYPITTYPNLFAAIGYTWGGAGANFNVPNMTRRVAVGSGGSNTSGTLATTVGSTGGEELHVLTTPELPAHSHTANVSDPGHQHFAPRSGGNSGSTMNFCTSGPGNNAGIPFSASPQFQRDYPFTISATTGISVSTNNTGSNTGHNTMQPSAVVTKIIKF